MSAVDSNVHSAGWNAKAGHAQRRAALRRQASRARPRGRSHGRKTIRTILLAAYLTFFLLPVSYLVSTSFKSPDEVLLGTFLPPTPTLANWPKAFQLVDLTAFIWHSLVIAAGAALLTLLVVLPATYATARLGFGRMLGSFTLGTYAAPPIVALLPLFFLLKRLDLLNSIPGMVLVYGIMNVPVAYWLLMGFVRQIPLALDEAAWLDGAGYLKTLIRIDLPLLVPSLVSVGLISGILSYNEFLFASIFAQKADVRGLTVGISLFQGDRLVNFGQMAVASLAGILPVYLIALLLQKRIVGGLLAGAVH